MKKSFKTKEVETKKLFYKKWLFKIVLECGGISYLHRRGIDYILKTQQTFTVNSWARQSNDTIFKNKALLLEIGQKLEEVLPGNEYQIRTESSTCAIFTNSESLIEQINTALANVVTEIHRPANAEQASFLKSNKNKVICNELPLEGFRYKIYFKNCEVKGTSGESFIKWANNFDDGRIHVPPGARKILEGKDHPYLYGQYFYAKDQKMASMALMIMGDYLNKTEEFVLKSEVNA